MLRINRCSTFLTLPPVRCYPSKTPVEDIIRTMHSIEICKKSCKIEEFTTWAHLPYMSMTAKTVVGKFEAATPCCEKIESVVKILGLMPSPEKKLCRIPGKSIIVKIKNMINIGQMWKIPPHWEWRNEETWETPLTKKSRSPWLVLKTPTYACTFVI